MDGNPQDHSQMSCPMIKIQSSDGVVFEIEVKVAKMSSYIKNMLDDLGFEDNEVIPIPQNAPEISGAILKKIIEWANHHKNDPVAADDDNKQVKSTDDMITWDTEFLQVDQSNLFQIIRAADYLNINGILDVACKKVAKMIKGKTREEVRRTFHIQNDFSPDEEEQVRKENAWCVRDGVCLEEYDGVYRRVVGKIPANSVQDEENDSSQVIQDCLNNSLVLRKIFPHFSDHELFELSCVSKSWNFEARSVMKKRGKIMARLVCSHCTPHSHYDNIEAFGAVLQQMNVAPHSGVIIDILSRGHKRKNAALDATYEAILTRLAFKHLTVRLDKNWSSDMNCSTFLLAKKLLQDFSGVLEQLRLDIRGKYEEFLEHVVQDCVFRRLKILTLTTNGPTRPDEAFTNNYIKAQVSRAPNLEELHIHEEINLMENILEGSSAVLVYEPMVTYPLDQILNSVMSAIRIQKLTLYSTGPEMDFERFNRDIPLLLQAPCFSRLRELWIDEVLAVPLMCYGIPLKNVTKLFMKICVEPVVPDFLMIVKEFDFTQIFPNLDEVSVWPNHYSFELSPPHVEIVEQADAVLREPKLDRAASIKSLNVRRPWGRYYDTAPFFAEMFPNIEKLWIEVHATEEIPFGSICTHWVDLMELHVEQTSEEIIANLDSVICGIFPEEVAELRQMDDEYLKTVNIVPVMPTITGLKNLKVLKMKFDMLTCTDPQHVYNNDTFLFSKVTGFIAFERCPSLTVGLEFWNFYRPPATTHLEPFTSVTFAFT